ncbi:MAG: DUF465 domain-containing protein [Rhodospirillales bacterium]|nr:DUF465 domain-containing protein [Rhodospirillales bacterium]MCB9965602.1 DUF465 domain-containing protein [Rhodospirillales bacterium]MCB9973951.1 DUF465 domain-containing protein [Rhodospirillales bacterium]MCB9980174.1 DUF465 domain-containing protein [Rhodospirillales bacterium]
MDDEEQLRELLIEKEQKHKDLDETIERLLDTAPVNLLLVQRMKKEKLQLKDEISRLKSALLPDIIA